MKIIKAEIKNFLTISEATMELSDRGLMLITGTNDDDTSANSNGAGKSSLVDALCWALYGSTARDVTADDVINEKAKKDCSVQLTIEDNGKFFNVSRYRKHKTFKNALIVSSVDSAGVEIDLSKGTDKETQLVVNSIVGCSSEVFSNAVYAGQERMPDLPSMTDKTLKVLIEEAAGIQILEEAHSIARKKLGESKDIANEELRKMELIDSNITNICEQLVANQKFMMEFDDTKKDRAKEHLKLCIPHLTVLRECVSAKGPDFYDPEIDELKTKLKSFDIVQENLTKLELEHRKAYVEANACSHLYETKKKTLLAMIDKVKNSQSLVGTSCKECGKEYCSDDLHGAIEAQKAQIKLERAEMSELEDKANKALELFNELELQVNELKRQYRQKDDVNLELQNSLQAKRLNDVMLEKIKNATDSIDRIKIEANEKLKEDNPFMSSIQELELKLDKLKKAKIKKQTEVDRVQAQVELHEASVKVFGPAGVRAHILDTVTPFLNSKTSEYLGALSDGNIHAVWTTLAPTAKGELKEKFSITVINDAGGSSFKKLSGGEKRKVRLATALALQDLVMSRATKPIGLWIADEIDYALDDSGLERLMGVLERKARERGTVLIISHQSGLRDWVDLSIDVIKKSGVSTITGDNLKVVA